MSDQDLFDDAEREADRLQSLSGDWLQLVPVQDNDGVIRVRVFTRAQFEVPGDNMGREVVRELRRMLDDFESRLP